MRETAPNKEMQLTKPDGLLAGRRAAHGRRRRAVFFESGFAADLRCLPARLELVNDSQTQSELAIFRNFAEVCPLNIIRESISKRNPPEPDVLCKLAESEEEVAFELVEIIDEGWACLTSGQFREAKSLREAYLASTGEYRRALDERIAKMPLCTFRLSPTLKLGSAVRRCPTSFVICRPSGPTSAANGSLLPARRWTKRCGPSQSVAAISRARNSMWKRSDPSAIRRSNAFRRNGYPTCGAHSSKVKNATMTSAATTGGLRQSPGAKDVGSLGNRS